MVTRSVTFSVSALARIAASDALCFSTKSTALAPRDRASNPRAPEPANRSSTRASGINCCKMLNHASRTRSEVGRTVRPVGVLRRRPLNSPEMMRSIGSVTPGRRRQTRNPGLDRHATLPVVPLEPKRHVERLAEPVFRHGVGPAEADGGQHAGAVVEREAQMIRADASRADGAHVPYAEHRRRIPCPARLEMANQSLEIFAQQRERRLEIHPLARPEIGRLTTHHRE